MAAGTAFSRVTGLARTVALASVLGVTAVADAYNTANTAPLMLYTLVAGGVLTSAVVPLLVRTPDGPGRREAASALVGFALTVGAALSLVAAIAAPWIMRVLTSGAAGRPDYDEFVRLGTSWLRTFSPQVAAYALSVVAVGILTSRSKLTLGAFAPVVTNVVTIVAAVVFAGMVGTQRLSPGSLDSGAVGVLGWGTTLGVAAMAGIQLWGARRSEAGLGLRVSLRHPVVRQLTRLGGWMLLYVGVNQAGLAAVIAMANSVPGGVSAYQWAFMLMQLPYAVIGVSLFSAALPGLARAASSEDEMSRVAGAASRAALAVVVPAAVGLALLARPVAAAVVGPGDARLVAAALAGFAVSLVPFTLFQLVTRICYAREDTRTPALVNVLVNAVNVAVDVAVVISASSAEIRIAGFALGHAASYVAGCAALLLFLRRSRVVVPGALARGTGRVCVATVVMGAALAWVPSQGQASTQLGALALAVGLSVAGAAIYGVAGVVVGVPAAVGRPGFVGRLKPRTRGVDESSRTS